MGEQRVKGRCVAQGGHGVVTPTPNSQAVSGAPGVILGVADPEGDCDNPGFVISRAEEQAT